MANVVDAVDVVKPGVETEVEVVEAGVDGDMRGRLDNTLLPVAVMSVLKILILCKSQSPVYAIHL